jgi:hypothetical protein
VLGSKVSSMDDLPGHVVSNGRSSAIRIAGLEPFVISDGFEVIDTKVRAAHNLLMIF